MTAVEFIVDELNKEMGLISFVTGTEESYKSAIFSIIEQAKEMEKEQKIKFAKHCLDKSIDLDILMAYNQVEIEYTNQTFKSE